MMPSNHLILCHPPSLPALNLSHQMSYQGSPKEKVEILQVDFSDAQRCRTEFRFPLLYYQNFFIIYFVCSNHATFGTFVPWSGIKPVPPALKAWSLNHWTCREVPRFHFRSFVFQESSSVKWIAEPLRVSFCLYSPFPTDLEESHGFQELNLLPGATQAIDLSPPELGDLDLFIPVFLMNSIVDSSVIHPFVHEQNVYCYVEGDICTHILSPQNKCIEVCTMEELALYDNLITLAHYHLSIWLWICRHSETFLVSHHLTWLLLKSYSHDHCLPTSTPNSLFQWQNLTVYLC